MILTSEKDRTSLRGGASDVVETAAGLILRFRRLEARPGDGAVAKWYSQPLPKATE
jgi:hypothetical protein